MPVCRSAREDSKAGTSPTLIPIRVVTARAKRNIEPSMPIAFTLGNPGGLRATKARTPATAMPIPSTPPIMARSRLSVSSCRMSLPFAAPSAARMANSARRWAPRASRRLVTLTHAMSRTRNTAPSTASSAGLTLRVTSICRGLTTKPLGAPPELSYPLAYSCPSVRKIPPASPCACWLVTPACNRPIMRR